MIQNSTEIQEMLDNILEQVMIIKSDFNNNGETHYNYVLEKLKKAQWDLNALVNYAEEIKGKVENSH